MGNWKKVQDLTLLLSKQIIQTQQSSERVGFCRALWVQQVHKLIQKQQKRFLLCDQTDASCQLRLTSGPHKLKRWLWEEFFWDPTGSLCGNLRTPARPPASGGLRDAEQAATEEISYRLSGSFHTAVWCWCCWEGYWISAGSLRRRGARGELRGQLIPNSPRVLCFKTSKDF